MFLNQKENIFHKNVYLISLSYLLWWSDLCCYNRIPHTGLMYNEQKFILLTVLEFGGVQEHGTGHMLHHPMVEDGKVVWVKWESKRSLNFYNISLSQ